MKESQRLRDRADKLAEQSQVAEDAGMHDLARMYAGQAEELYRQADDEERQGR